MMSIANGAGGIIWPLVDGVTDSMGPPHPVGIFGLVAGLDRRFA